MTELSATTIEINWADLGMVEQTARKVCLKGLNKLAHVMLGEADKIVQRDTGTLARSGKVSQDTRNGYVKITFSTPYARIQHEGGTIRAKKGKFLKFKNKEGKDVFVKSVTIMGTKYLERPFNELKGKAQFYAEEAIANYYIKHKYSDEAVLKGMGE